MTSVAVDRRTDAADRSVDRLRAELELHRRELTGYCYRMLGSIFDAEDAVQDTMVRAWRAAHQFDGRSTVRTWVYRIATNVCLDLLAGRKRRALPMDLGPASQPGPSGLGAPRPSIEWVEPAPDGAVLPESADPADLAIGRESIRLAFVAALQHLPGRQRAVLILRDVLRFSAEEVAGQLGTTVAAVNSASQRARATMAARQSAAIRVDAMDDRQQQLLASYVDAFERYDVDALVGLLRADAIHTMPPYDLWLQGADEIGRWLLGPGSACRGSRLVPVDVNGLPAFAHYKPSATDGGLEPFNLQVLEVSGGRIARFTHFLDVRLFPAFGLPASP